MRYDTRDYPPRRGYYYIVYLNDFVRVTLYTVYFINRESAKRAVESVSSNQNRVKFRVITGKMLEQYTLNYTISLGLFPRFSKYDFPVRGMSRGDKKNFRTISRRRLRRMGMLVPKESKLSVFESPKLRELLVNKQRVADSPNTLAKGFRLEGLPQKYYFLIVERSMINKRGILMRVSTIRYNIKSGAMRRCEMDILNRDVVIPYLMTEILSKAKQRGNYNRLLEYYIKYKNAKINESLKGSKFG